MLLDLDGKAFPIVCQLSMIGEYETVTIYNVQTPERGSNDGHQRTRNREATPAVEVSKGLWLHERLDHFAPRTPVQRYRLLMTLHGAQRY